MTMQLYFLRHGTAEERAFGKDDSQRQLTPQGRAEMRSIAKGLARLNLKVDTILSSPLARALQTAQIVAEALDLNDHLIVDRRLGGGCDLDELSEVLREHSPGERVMLVGHNPDFSELVGELAGGMAVELKKGGLARVDTETVAPGRGILIWLLTPKHLALLGSQ